MNLLDKKYNFLTPVKFENLKRYEKNKVIFFMNTVNSIHRVTPRESCELPRNLTNIIFETYNQKDNLFKVNYKKFF